MSTELPTPENLTPLKRAIVEIRTLKEQLAAQQRTSAEPIAVVGLGLRFPGDCNTPEDYWSLLRDGVDAVGLIPPERWDVADFYDADRETPGKMTTRHGAFLGGVDQFSPRFFGIAPREAEQMDPQQRLLLQVTWEALERAGQATDRLDGSATGVFVGICGSDYMRMLAADPAEIDVYLATGSAGSVASGRISYLLGLQGPSIAVDSACSSSLVAVHLAMRSLRQRECNLALAGGVNLILAPDFNITFSKSGMLADDGRCKTFDAAADGYVRGEGCAMIVLKRLSDALADGDRVLAVLRGSAVNQDGRSSGLTAPNGLAQEAVVRSALADAGLTPAAVSYVEAHGTGTALGDPIELRALGAVYGAAHAPEEPLLVGSVKTNFGHVEAAAGVAGLIKVVLMLEHGIIVPHLHLATRTPHIDWTRAHLDVPTALQQWKAAGPRRAGVSSFGFSGTNAHVIIEEAPTVAARPAQMDAPTRERPLHLITLSARSEQALRTHARNISAHIGALSAAQPDVPLADIAYSVNVGRSHYEQRLAAVAVDAATLCAQLDAFAAAPTADAPTTRNSGIVSGVAAPGAAPEVVFLFTGHGSHYAGMGKALYTNHPVFRAAIDRCAALLESELDRPLAEILFGGGELFADMRYAQPALFALQVALVELWRAWGVHPAAVAGHSAGEYAAAVCAGVLSLEDGLRLVTARGRLMQSLPPNGEMVALFVDEARVAAALRPYIGRVDIAAINGPQAVVISGHRDAVRAVLEEMALDADEFRRLEVGVAAHSPLIEPIVEDFARTVATVRLSKPQIAFASSLTGGVVGTEVATPAYWRSHLRQPVRFADALEALRQAGYRAFVEIGPHTTLLGFGQRTWPDADALWAPSLRRDKEPWEQMLGSLAALYVAGVPVDWVGFDRPWLRRKVTLPTYPWENARYWSPAARRQGRAAPADRWPALAHAARNQAQQGPLDLRIEGYPARWALLDQLADAYIVRALRMLGLFAHAGEGHTLAGLVEKLGAAPSYAHLLARWLGGLADAGLLVRTPQAGDNADRFEATRPLPEPQLEPLLAQAQELFADSQPLLDYVTRCGERLAAVLTGEESALSTLFPDGSYETADYIYSQWSPVRYFNNIVAAAAQAAAQASGRGGAEPLRVLEIGAGTGGTTAALLPLLPADATRYTFSDVSEFFLARAAERFAAYPFVNYALCDVEKPLDAQGLAHGSYDLVVAANVLHATRDLSATLRNVQALLASGGALLLYETTEHPRWFDITTGLIEGWQRFEDAWRSDNPLLDAPTWAKALTEAGFVEVIALPEDGSPTALLNQHVIAARSPGAPTHARASGSQPAALMRASAGGEPAATVGAPSAATSVYATTDWAVQRAHLFAALPSERKDLLVDFVRRSIAQVLRIADPNTLRRDQPLLDLGFDSLMAVDLRNTLRRNLELTQKLPATLVFDHPTIAEIARYLERIVFADAGAPQSEDAAGPGTGARVQKTPAPAAALSAEAIASLSDAEVEEMLMKRLAEMQGES